MSHDKNIMEGTILIFPYIVQSDHNIKTINLKHFIIFFSPISISRPKRLDKDKRKYVQIARVYSSTTHSMKKWRKVS